MGSFQQRGRGGGGEGKDSNNGNQMGRVRTGVVVNVGLSYWYSSEFQVTLVNFSQ